MPKLCVSVKCGDGERVVADALGNVSYIKCVAVDIVIVSSGKTVEPISISFDWSGALVKIIVTLLLSTGSVAGCVGLQPIATNSAIRNAMNFIKVRFRVESLVL